MLKVFWWLIIILHYFGLRVLFKATLKQIERWIISTIENIFHVLFQRDLKLSSWVTFSNFEFAFLKSLKKPIYSPILEAWPVISHALDNHWLWTKLILLQKVLLAQIRVLDSINCIKEIPIRHFNSAALGQAQFSLIQQLIAYLILPLPVFIPAPMVKLQSYIWKIDNMKNNFWRVLFDFLIIFCTYMTYA